jgi:hypothetical protein
MNFFLLQFLLFGHAILMLADDLVSYNRVRPTFRI